MPIETLIETREQIDELVALIADSKHDDNYWLDYQQEVAEELYNYIYELEDVIAPTIEFEPVHSALRRSFDKHIKVDLERAAPMQITHVSLEFARLVVAMECAFDVLFALNGVKRLRSFPHLLSSANNALSLWGLRVRLPMWMHNGQLEPRSYVVFDTEVPFSNSLTESLRGNCLSITDHIRTVGTRLQLELIGDDS